MTGVQRLSILVADDDPGVIEDYRTILCAPKSSPPPDLGNWSCIEDDLFRVALAHERFPEVDLCVAAKPEVAIQAVKRRAKKGRRYTMAFIGVELRDGDRGLAAAGTIRAMDPDMPIVLVAARCGMHPLDVYDRIPLTAQVAILVKPFHAVEIQSLALSMAAERRTENPARAVAATRPRITGSNQSVPRIPLRKTRGQGADRSDFAGALNPGRSADRAPSADENGAD
jgi:CheY-like chemotaxis protein